MALWLIDGLMPDPEASQGSVRFLVPEPTLREHARNCFGALGLSAADAESVADVLMFASLRGLDAHGFERLPVYMRRVHAGLAGGTEAASVVAAVGAVCRFDAAHALGPAIGRRAVDHAMDLAGAHGIGLVLVGNSTHFGPAGYYTLRAARRGFLAIAASNAAKLMAPHGATRRFLGTNPISFAAPVAEGDEFVLDISSSSVAGGKIRRAATLGEPIAEGLALDPAGNPTVDPAQAIAGALLPLGAHKGSGLALAISIFVAMLAEAEFDDLVASHYHDRHPQNLGQLFIVIDPSAVVDREQAERRVAGFLERLHGLADDGEGSEIHYPGEGAAEHERIRRRFGIPVAREDIDALASTCEECGLPALAEQTRRLVAEAPTVTSNVQQPEGKTTR